MKKNLKKDWILLKKFINIWLLRGFFIYGKVIVIKFLLIFKFVYILFLFLIFKELVKDLNRLLFKFLWKGIDKVIWVLIINDFEYGGLKMIDIDSMIVFLRLVWLKWIFSENGGIWKSYLCYFLECFGGLFFINCNYDLKDYLKFF